MDVLIVFLLLFAAFYGLVVALIFNIARNKGRDPYLWALLALLISPIGALILLAVLPPVNGPAGRPPGAPA